MQSVFERILLLLLAFSLWLPNQVGASTVPVQTLSAQQAKEVDAETVYVTRTGKKYHRERCRSLSRSKIKTTVKEAQANGYTPCKVCRPPG